MKDLVEKIQKKIKEQTRIIADSRDKLEDLEMELQDILGSFNEGIENLELGLDYIKDGINNLSERV